MHTVLVRKFNYLYKGQCNKITPVGVRIQLKQQFLTFGISEYARDSTYPRTLETEAKLGNVNFLRPNTTKPTVDGWRGI